MSWQKYAKHKCGHVIDLPFNNYRFLVDFITYCPKCGDQYEVIDLDLFVGRYVYKGKWYNPFTWFNFELERKKED